MSGNEINSLEIEVTPDMVERAWERAATYRELSMYVDAHLLRDILEAALSGVNRASVKV